MGCAYPAINFRVPLRMRSMKSKRYTAKQVTRKLAEGDKLFNVGATKLTRCAF